MGLTKKLQDRIAKFLAKPNRGSGGEWPEDITPKEINELHNLFHDIIVAKFGEDYDKSPPVSVTLCNHKRQCRIYFEHPPNTFSRKDMTDETIRQLRQEAIEICAANISSSSERLRTELQIQRWHEREVAEKENGAAP